ncbi:hypothetical protein [Streptomyces sp. NPDC049970]|uniref:hypothetical protein n=1 Tax=Streptomyces sp. NPDC049970 TaxID=3155033 RepID=UPI00343930A8
MGYDYPVCGISVENVIKADYQMTRLIKKIANLDFDGNLRPLEIPTYLLPRERRTNAYRD